MGSKHSRDSSKSTAASSGEATDLSKHVKSYLKERSKNAIKLTDYYNDIELFVPRLLPIQKSSIMTRRDALKVRAKIPKSTSSNAVLSGLKSDPKSAKVSKSTHSSSFRPTSNKLDKETTETIDSPNIITDLISNGHFLRINRQYF